MHPEQEGGQLTMKKRPMFLPLVLGSLQMSAIMPGTMAIGALAKTPVKSLKTRKAGQVGASAQANVLRVKAIKVLRVGIFRPNCSLRGAQRIGPDETLLAHASHCMGALVATYP
jgi:hypothetical protein